jgi:diguanylate cyclase (GGDEF)-like protein
MGEHALSVDRNAPARFLRFLLWTALVSSVAILSLAGYGISKIYVGHIIEATEHDAISIGESILALERHLFLHPGSQGIERLIIDESEYPELDSTMKKLLSPLDIVKIKVFSKEGEIIYSTDHSIIGQKNPENLRLQIALSGEASSKMQQKGEISDLIGERRYNVDVVETYIPILNNQSMIVGSFEIYRDITRSNFEIRQGVKLSLITLATILTLAFSLSFLVVRAATKKLTRVQNQLHTMATQDSLTGLNNRAMIMQAVTEETARTRRRDLGGENTPFSLIMIDIDRFKSINDNHGHPVGDKVLREVASTFRSTLREYDLAGRYGGEEFLVLLPDTGLEGAKLFAERVRLGVEKLSIIINQKRIPVTVSLGVATVFPNESGYEAVLKRADEGLYIAKNEGRNRVGCTASQQRASLKPSELPTNASDPAYV